MTREQKIEWLKNATLEELMKRYDLAYFMSLKEDESFIEWHELARVEILNRMSK